MPICADYLPMRAHYLLINADYLPISADYLPISADQCRLMQLIANKTHKAPQCHHKT